MKYEYFYEQFIISGETILEQTLVNAHVMIVLHPYANYLKTWWYHCSFYLLPTGKGQLKVYTSWYRLLQTSYV
jgi:hypothetical protein